MPDRSRRGASSRNQLQTLLRILERERELDFNDAAVIGGLDAFLARWRSELAPVLGEQPFQGRAYADLTPRMRAAWADAVRAAAAGKRPPVATRVATAPPRPPSTGRPTTADASTTREKSAPRPKTGLAKPAPSHRRAAPPVSLDTPVEDLPFVNRRIAPKLERLEVSTLRDLLYMFPFRHVDYARSTKIAELEVGMETTVVARVRETSIANIGGGGGATRAVVSDGTGLMTVTWFRQPYLARRLKPGAALALSGRVQEFRGQARFQNPEYEVLDEETLQRGLVHAGNLLPVYPSTEGLLQRTLRNVAKKALDAGLPMLDEFLPDVVRQRHDLPGLRRAVRDMHLPPGIAERERARRRLAFDELFRNQVAVQRRRAAWRKRGRGVAIRPPDGVLDGFVASLSYRLTGDQRRILAQIVDEIATDVPMGRLLQGEVGSGKTVVALAALLATAAAGYQGALMAPTEVLTEQHFLSICAALGAVPADEGAPGAYTLRVAAVPGLPEPVRIGLLIGSLSPSAKARMRERLAANEVNIVVGTHALLQEAVNIPRLAFAVIDEQHRFGVQQRAALHEKGLRPHVLAMSATPIPRSLALTLYGDLDLSTLRELPSGRQPVETRWMRSEENRRESYDLIRSEARAGRQAFVVCPLIEESEQVPARAAVKEFELLSRAVFPDLRVGLLHGRMPLAEKQEVMDRCRDGEVDLLVATPVIEVGIDIPNATVMMIESADRFGLSQLHQLRGRVGRGRHRSYCLLLADQPGGDARQRLGIIERLADGFALAEEDLRMRGPGDYVGTRQSGFPDLKVATLADVDLMQAARSEAAELLSADPDLSAADHAALAAELERTILAYPAEIS